ncbi:uncharacterized protein LOC129942136 [Eupeodes corollae]|uniref:uncharacterized protein LOC129942136 n=1 Tax=Eupeodes corollae TaxID=290404 RepID=UPI00248FD309|nr:uncharacterized protein LOC129942136 [Eupeodes corollae]
MLAGQLMPLTANQLPTNALQASSNSGAKYFGDEKFQHEKQLQRKRRQTSMTASTTTQSPSVSAPSASSSPVSSIPTTICSNATTKTTATPATSPKPPVVGAATIPSTRDQYYREVNSPRNRRKFEAAVGETPGSRCDSEQRKCNDASGRSAALERAYVHDVYENCEEPSGTIRPKVAQFLGALDAGSVVCDVGCGSGRYLTQCNPAICTIGIDRCHRLSKVAREKGGEVAVCDNLELPFRDESFDAVLSLAVVHHFATTERRVGAIRELARILRIGGRVIISVWALEQRQRRFESQDVLIPWQPPKSRTQSYSDEEDEDDILPPYNAYVEESTNSSRSAGDGDSSSLSSSSPGESCYSFVRRAIQKLAGSKRHPWFLDSWTSKDTKNNSSLDFEDAKDLPIELRRLEDFEDFPDPPLSAGLKSRSLGSILNPPPRQIVRSRSSVPSLGAQMMEPKQLVLQTSPGQVPNSTAVEIPDSNSNNSPGSGSNTNNAPSGTVTASSTPPHSTMTPSRRPKLIKQKQSLCDEDYQLPDNPFHMISNSSSSNSLNNNNQQQYQKNTRAPIVSKHQTDAKVFLRKQSSLNEELMAGNRIREKERVRKRIQKQMSLNEAFLCRSVFSKRLQVLRDGFTSKLKTSTGSLERVTKNGFVKIMQNFKASTTPNTSTSSTTTNNTTINDHYQYHNHAHHSVLKQGSFSLNKSNEACNCGLASAVAAASSLTNGNEDQSNNKPRRSSRESGSDSSKDSSFQSDTSIESEDSFASVIFIPKPELQQQQQGHLAAQKHQQQIYHQQNSNSSSSNSSSSYNGAHNSNCNSLNQNTSLNSSSSKNRIPSVPTSPLIMPCPPTPAHSPAAAYTVVTSPPQTTSSVQAAMAILTPPKLVQKYTKTNNSGTIQEKSRFTFEDEHIQQLESTKSNNSNTSLTNGHAQIASIVVDKPDSNTKSSSPPLSTKITHQTIKDLPPIPKFRKQQSLQINKPGYAIVRRASMIVPTIPKFMSLELFNPATDDLDSDSSEPSSPDSIDSVISAPKSAQPDEVSHKGDVIKSTLHLNGDGASMENLNVDDDSVENMPYARVVNKIRPATHQECVDFAEQLSAQLLRELDEKNRSDKIECRSLDGIGGDIGDYIDDPVMANFRKRNSDLTALRDELRERRLMLANLSTQPSLQQSPNSSSTSSLSSQTRSLTIHEEDEEEEEREEAEGNSSNSYSLNLYDNYKISKFKYKRNRQYSLNPETAYLLDDGDSSAREDDDDVILEEDEDVKSDEGVLDDDPHEDGTITGEGEKYATKTTHNTIKCDENSLDENKKQDGCGAVANRQSTIESWENSNSSTASLDSPTQGGATTHHRYYHVFREGELDALINHHVASLHIVSSYYERASWCVVAEKVQVWTI